MEKINDAVYHLPEIVGGPTILLGDSITIVDTGVPGSDAAIFAAVGQLGRTPAQIRDIVLTHADGDHIGGLTALVGETGATVWAGDAEADVVEGRAPHRGGEVERSGTVDARFTPGEMLPLHHDVETLDTRGHTSGHVSLFLREAGILIAGDCLNNRDGLTGSAPEHTAHPALAREAVRTVAELRPQTILFGHGPSIVGGAAEQLVDLLARIG